MANLPPIMLVEDGAEDFEALARSLQKAGVSTPVYRFSHGEEALDFLHHRGRYFKPGSAPRPGIILLDLNLPGTDGRQVLAEIKGHESLKTIPVIVLTSSADPRDIDACYRAGANTFLHKPMDTDGFVEMIRRLKAYWFDMALLPTDPER